MPPAYRLKDFVAACAAGQIFVPEAVLDGAGPLLGCDTQQAVADFVANGGMQHHKYKPPNTWDGQPSTWDRNPNPEVPVYIDEYEFCYGTKCIYIAFMKPPGGVWIVKSIKPSWNKDHVRFCQRRSLHNLKR